MRIVLIFVILAVVLGMVGAEATKKKSKSKRGKEKKKGWVDSAIIPIQKSFETGYNLVQSASLEYFPSFLLYLFKIYRELSPFLNKNQIIDDEQPVYYDDNFASLNGGAVIMMKTSDKISYSHSILLDDSDKYMYTNEPLPIQVSIGLTEQIAISSICLRSIEMYSSIPEYFEVYGTYSRYPMKWTLLGSFKAENNFLEQEFFFAEKKIVRYIYIKFLSSYGQWTYFSVTQVKVRGKSLFADAAHTTTLQEKQPEQDIQEQKAPQNVCSNEFRVYNQEPHESNVITSLLNKMEQLQMKNKHQQQKMRKMEEELLKVQKQLSDEKTKHKKHQHAEQTYWSKFNMYATFGSMIISLITLFLLLCFYLFGKEKNVLKTPFLKARKSASTK